jgi:hypothetical protein
MQTEEEFWLYKKQQQQKLLSIEATNHLPSVDLQVETQAATYYLALLQLPPDLSLSLSLSLAPAAIVEYRTLVVVYYMLVTELSGSSN